MVERWGRGMAEVAVALEAVCRWVQSFRMEPVCEERAVDLNKVWRPNLPRGW
jgi:hypothetical protein